MKRILAAAVVIVLLFSVFAYAVPKAAGGKPTLTFSGTSATCRYYIAESGSSISVTMRLYQGSNLLNTWTKSGMNYVNLSKTANATSGLTYTLQVNGYIDGVPFTATPATGTCP